MTILSANLLLLVSLVSSPTSVDLRFLQVIDTEGNVQRLAANADRRGTAFIFLSTKVDSEATQTLTDVAALNALAESVKQEEIVLFGVVAESTATREEAKQLAEQVGSKFPIIFDATGELTRAFAPIKASHAFLIDATGSIVYQGKVQQESEKKHYLRDAVNALVEGAKVPVAFTEVDGPSLELEDSGEVTFSRQIAPILFANCTECHRAGQVAPFALLSYEDASKRAEFLSDVTKSRLMPPWRAELDYGHFEDERRLTDRQIELIEAWVRGGAPAGSEQDLPPVPQYPQGWRLGKPDLVLEAPVPYTVPADGPDIFQHFVIPIQIPEDKTLIGFEYRPSNPVVAHHAVLFLDATGGAREKDAETPEPGFRTSGSVEGSVTAFVGVWTPGMTPRFYPEGIGIRVPKQIDLVLQMHLHPSGKEEVERSKIALYFSDQPAEEIKRQQMLLLGSLAIDIPPGASEHRLGSKLVLPIDLTVLSVFPHLHLIGKEMKVTATLPGGESQPLIWIKDWNFYWQDSYLYCKPILLPKGTEIRVEAAYDNSAANPFNPNHPPQRVLFGNGSADEMCFAFFQYVTDEKQSGMRMGPALMQSMLSEWRKLDIDDAARDRIIDEAGKLFGRRSKDMLRSVLTLSGKNSNKTKAESSTP